MRIDEIVDGPKQGSQVFQAMDRDTQNLLRDVKIWKQEIKKAKIQAAREKTREKDLSRNDVIKVGMYRVPVPDLEQWIDTGDDEIMYKSAVANRTAFKGGPAKDLQRVRDTPQWQNLIRNIWQEAAGKMYPSLRDKYPHFFTTHLDSAANILWRPYRIENHVDLKGRRYSPHIEHPELDLPQDHVLLHVQYK